jgi:teichoic acid transport system ATP-binding protein
VAEAQATTVADQGASPTGKPNIVVDEVHVTYHVHGDTRPHLRDLIRGETVATRERNVRRVEAVRGVSFSAAQGEAIGIIGRNGSGKSTLMRAMAGLLPVTSGTVYARSQPSLLGVGAALQGALSGRRNILLGGLALGLTKVEVEERTDEIIDFADLREFIDLPLKTYSSGMKARLLFSISTAVRPEILLIDEALAVGDEEFKDRSKERIRELVDGAGTVFIVSHSTSEIEQSCSRAIWLDKGRILMDDEPKAVVKKYKESVAGRKKRRTG